MKQEMRHWGVLPTPAVVREDMAGVKAQTTSASFKCDKITVEIFYRLSVLAHTCLFYNVNVTFLTLRCIKMTLPLAIFTFCHIYLLNCCLININLTRYLDKVM